MAATFYGKEYTVLSIRNSPCTQSAFHMGVQHTQLSRGNMVTVYNYYLRKRFIIADSSEVLQKKS